MSHLTIYPYIIYCYMTFLHRIHFNIFLAFPSFFSRARHLLPQQRLKTASMIVNCQWEFGKSTTYAKAVSLVTACKNFPSTFLLLKMKCQIDINLPNVFDRAMWSTYGSMKQQNIHYIDSCDKMLKRQLHCSNNETLSKSKSYVTLILSPTPILSATSCAAIAGTNVN